MTYRTMEAARIALIGFMLDYGGANTYRIEQVPKGYRVAVYSEMSGTFLTYV